MTKNFEEFTLAQARGYASMVTRLAKGYSESGRVRATIKSTVETTSAGRFIIRVRAGGKAAPDARAREYGSGLWARRGPRGKILIRPKNKRALAFPWETPTSPFSWGYVHENVPRLPDGRVVLKQVEHPGIDADNDGKGYIGPAVRETNKAIRNKFVTDGKKAIILDIRASFKGARSA